jgi:very-short-patch-repair endonuclease
MLHSVPLAEWGSGLAGLATSRARRLRADQTDAERRLWSRLRGHRLDGVQFRRQQPIGAYIVDFVAFSHRVVVELDGGQHAEQEAYDAERTAWLEAQGFRVLRFWNDAVLRETDTVVAAIQAALTAS